LKPLQTYITSLPQEFEQIPQERKETLTQVAAYVRRKTAGERKSEARFYLHPQLPQKPYFADMGTNSRLLPMASAA
jgi:hypothetical protein